MLVICEDCAKKYSIDEKRIKAPKVKFNCRACGHIIIVEKPKLKKSTSPPAEKLSSTAVFAEHEETNEVASQQEKGQGHGKQADKKENIHQSEKEPSPAVQAALRHSAAAAGKGVPFFFYLLAVMLFGLLLISTVFFHVYFNTIPDVLHDQLELRSLALTESLKGTIHLPLVRKDYLTVNQEVKRISKLPGVAYAAVRNAKGIVVAGFFNNRNSFDNHFAQKVKERGFQPDVLVKNTLPAGQEWSGAKISVGGIFVYDQVTVLPDVGGELHVALQLGDFDRHFFKTLLAPLTVVLLGLFLLSGYIVFVLLDKLVTEPMRSLTNIANRISLGELDLAITSAGPREIRELGAGLERMRHSIKVAMERLKR
ncbi:MAG: zinc-ribbon domain-containing protein [Candidatus Electrothrix aestuarii]|uniref:Zinc-ribbon domain-containing protein n=1 Tax=Candidatus Electrothrix aestuarii TaxID=3062594 RepID=A0AAU8LTB0_9BACT|nr:zinc-ribbon domain-containing protein [Candidatus Electrothrix aestuarii]